MSKSEVIPKILIDQIKEGNVVLFLGAGAAFDSTHPKNKKPPTGRQLADLIAEKFLGEEYLNQDLQYVSELAISEADLFTVQNFIADIFKDFGPGEHHLKIPTFVWKSIYTTNYDRIIEEAYNKVKERQQELATFIKNGERVRDKMTSPDSLMFTKLHGCITDINDSKTPLILTPDQYVEHRANRDRLFARLQQDSYEHPIIFAGFSFADWDIRYTLKDLESLGTARPRSYMVGPSITDAEDRLWENKKVTSIRLSFLEFMRLLDAEISESDRSLSKVFTSKQIEHPIGKKFVSGAPKMGDTLLNFLNHDVKFIHSNLAETESDPQNFYKGHFENFDPIIKNLDVERGIKDDILSEVFLIDEEERSSDQDIYLIKGNAGSGKTVMLRRLAWDAAVTFNKLCLYYNSDVTISYESINDLYLRVKERIYLFIDKPSEHIDDIDHIITRSKKDNVLITIITSERGNVWNMECERLNNYLTSSYTLTYLNDKEINGLLKLLEKHKSLNYLEKKTEEERREALSEKAGRELLVALHEATAGKPFADIIYDEYKSIPSDEAKSLYLTICIFHRLGAYTRAGIISRIHKINFSYFKEKLFKPLESIVFTNRNYRINDYIYYSRHQHIAELVFEQVLVNTEDRLDEYCRILSKLDVDYESDFQAFLSMTNGKKLLESFRDPEAIRRIYEVAKENVGEVPSLMQQEAIFEMNSPSGNFEKASDLLSRAHKIEPFNSHLSHSKAEFALRRAINTTQTLLKNKYLEEAKRICIEIISNRRNKNIIHAYHTLLKTHIEELREIFNSDDVEGIEKKVLELEKLLNKAIQLYPKESFILDAQSNFNELLDKEPQALDALQQAYKNNKRSPYLATRLSDYYSSHDKKEKALEVLNETLSLNQNNQDLNFKYAMLLSELQPENYIDLKHYFRKSFTKGDKRHEAQFWYARCVYLLKEYDEAKLYFDHLNNIPLDYRIKKNPRGHVIENGKPLIIEGAVTKAEISYGFIKRDYTGESLYFSNKGSVTLKKNDRAKMRLAFNYHGPVADIIY